MVYNKLLPRVQTLLSRFMDQLYRRGQHDIVGVRARKRSDVDRAPKVQGLLNYQLETLNDIDEQGGSYLFNMQWMFSAITFGKGIAKLYWKKEERIAPKRVTVPIPITDNMGRLVGLDQVTVLQQAPQIIYNGPYAEVIHPKLCVPHPHYKSIQKMPAFFCVYRKSMDYVKEMEEKGIFKNTNLLGYSQRVGISTGTPTSIGEDSSEAIAKSIEIEGAFPLGDHDSDRAAPYVDIVEGYGKYIFPEDETPYEVGSGYKIKGRESEAIVHIGNYRTLLSIQKNTYGMRPFFDIGAYYHPEMFWDLGIIRLGKDLQEAYNNLANVRYQNAIQTVNQMIMVRQDADIDPQALTWKPFGIIPVEDLDNDVRPFVQPDVSQSGIFREQEQFFFEDTLADMTGMYAYNLGQEPKRQEYVGTIYSLQSMGEARTKLLLMTMDFMGFQPFLKHMMRLNTWHLPEGFEARIVTQQGDQYQPLFSGDIHVDYDFTARYTALEPALAKEFRIQQLIQFAQMWMQTPYLQHHAFMKAIMELMDFHDSDRYLKTPEQVMQEQQMMQQQAMQSQIMGAQIQDQLTAGQQERELVRDVAKALLK